MVTVKLEAKQDGVKQQAPGLVATVDQGTTSNRCIIYNNIGEIQAKASIETNSQHPHEAWSEQDPSDYLDQTLKNMQEAIRQLGEDKVEQIKAVGITNQRETTILFDKKTGQLAYKSAVLWADNRTKDLVERLSADKESVKEVKRHCGLEISTYFSAVKVRWLLDNDENVREIYDRGDLCFANVDSWIIYNLTGGANGGTYASDVTNVTRTMLVNLSTLQYDDWLIKYFGFEKLNLPEIRTCSEDFGTINYPDCPLNGKKILGCIGDQSAALMGHLGFDVGESKITYGTGCFFLYNTGPKLYQNEQGLFSTVAFQQKGHVPQYAQEGAIKVCASIVRWQQQMSLLETPSHLGHFANMCSDNNGLYFVTAFNGLLGPYWSSYATGTMLGMRFDTNRFHMARSAVEAIGYQTRALLDCVRKDTGATLDKLKIDGGLSNSSEIMQIQADVMGITLEKAPAPEPTSLGAAIAAGLQCGLWKDLDDVREKLTSDDHPAIYKGHWSKNRQEHHFKTWNLAVQAAHEFGIQKSELDKAFNIDDEVKESQPAPGNEASFSYFDFYVMGKRPAGHEPPEGLPPQENLRNK